MTTETSPITTLAVLVLLPIAHNLFKYPTMEAMRTLMDWKPACFIRVQERPATMTAETQITSDFEAANKKYAASFTKGDLPLPPSRLVSHRRVVIQGDG